MLTRARQAINVVMGETEIEGKKQAKQNDTKQNKTKSDKNDECFE